MSAHVTGEDHEHEDIDEYEHDHEDDGGKQPEEDQCPYLINNSILRQVEYYITHEVVHDNEVTPPTTGQNKFIMKN